MRPVSAYSGQGRENGAAQSITIFSQFDIASAVAIVLNNILDTRLRVICLYRVEGPDG